jgi:Zn-dependent peptidase ImmA (M78 family)
VRNEFLDQGTAREIDKLIDRVHRNLGASDGPIVPAEVRDMLQLDLRYYTIDDPTVLQEAVHKMRVGAAQVIRRPALLVEAVKKFDLKGLFLPDRKRILLDSSLPDLKKRWSESHEIVHSLIPWHQEYLFGDTKETLSPTCHQQLEHEANYGAGRLLFPHKAMLDIAAANPPSIAHIKSIAAYFGNTISSTLWRYVEYCAGPCFGVIAEHPRSADSNVIGTNYFIRSAAFAAEFGSVTETALVNVIRGYCTCRRSGPLGSAEIIFRDSGGMKHIFRAESFGNTYQVLTLGSYLRGV